MLKLTYSKVVTQICGGHPGPSLQGRVKGESGEGGGVGERRELSWGWREKMGKGRGGANKARERAGDGTEKIKF